ncbi:MAG: hypothetical protein ACK5LX_14400 [Oscillospiraceae bacterium]
MNKKQWALLGGSVLAVALLCVAVVVFFRVRNTPAIPEAEIPAVSEASEEPVSAPVIEEASKPAESSTIEVPEIKSSAPDVIPDSSGSETDNLPTPGVTESADGNGGVVQTPNWEEQKTLKEGTDLEDASKEPEYVGSASKAPVSEPPTTKEEAQASQSSSQASSTGSTSTSSSAKNGDTKTIDGVKYVYVEGFGWVKDGGANQGTVGDVGDSLSGNKVGH